MISWMFPACTVEHVMNINIDAMNIRISVIFSGNFLALQPQNSVATNSAAMIPAASAIRAQITA